MPYFAQHLRKGVQFYFPSRTYPAIPYCTSFPILEHCVQHLQKSPLGKIPKPQPDSHLDHLVTILSLINGIWSSDGPSYTNGQKETTYVASPLSVLPTGHFHTKHRAN